MSPFAEFVHRLLHEGQARLHGPPSGADAEAAAVLARAFVAHRRTVAGPPLDFDEPAALAAAVLVQQACWFLVSHAEPPPELEQRLALPAPRSPAEHLSADLTLRLLPQVHRRARARDPADPLVGLLAGVLRRWPLSGVLAAVDEEPLTPPEFAGHRGLLLLYAERWGRHSKPAWLPRGPGLEYVELVWAEQGKDVALLWRLAEPAGMTDGERDD